MIEKTKGASPPSTPRTQLQLTACSVVLYSTHGYVNTEAKQAVRGIRQSWWPERYERWNLHCYRP
jgi:hypothetical protein